MPERFSIDEYFAEARDRDDKPLVAQEQIPAILAYTSRKRTVQRTSVRPTAARFAPVVSAAALLLIAVFMLPDSTDIPTGTQAGKERSTPVPLYTESPLAGAESPVGQQESVREVPAEQAPPHSIATDDAGAMALRQSASAVAETSVGQSLITLSKDQLARIGITATDTEASYTGLTAPRTADIARRLDISVEQLQSLADKGNIDLRSYLTPVQVTMRTNGVGTRTVEQPSNTTAAVAPRMVGIYSGNRLLAAYWQRSDNELVDALRRKYSHLHEVRPDSSVSRLVPVHFTLANKRDSYFKKADVVMWFEASPEFVDALPEPYRSTLRQEKENIVIAGTPGERYMEIWRTTAGAVIETSLYPNPVLQAGGSATLAYRLDSERQVTITLHDIFGRELASFRTEYQQPGSYTAEIPLAGRESGVYLVALTTDRNERAVRRLLVQR